MKNHIVTIILLLLAAVAFTLRFFVNTGTQLYCDIAAFALPTFAAMVEIVVAELSGKETEKQLNKLKDNQLSVFVEGKTLFVEKGENE